MRAAWLLEKSAAWVDKDASSRGLPSCGLALAPSRRRILKKDNRVLAILGGAGQERVEQLERITRKESAYAGMVPKKTTQTLSIMTFSMVFVACGLA